MSFTDFIWASILSAGRQISSVFVSVKLYSRRGLSLAFVSQIPKFNRSLSISSGVILSKSHPTAATM